MATPTLSVVINTRNEAEDLRKCLKSVEKIADEIIVMDMMSEDDTVKVAKSFGAKVFSHKHLPFVEPARNAAIAKATSDWILLLDPDESISPPLAKTIREELMLDTNADAYFLPRKNIIFGEWVKTGWWPDLLLRLFRRDTVTWPNKIHGIPEVFGQVVRLQAKENLAITHENYTSIDEFIDRAQRYTSVSAQQRIDEKRPPLPPIQAFFDELFRRYYEWTGFRDGSHGMVLSVLSASVMAMERAKYWEAKGYPNDDSVPKSLSKLLFQYARDARYWERHYDWQKSSGVKRRLKKVLIWLGL